jgi:hypothetical protein
MASKIAWTETVMSLDLVEPSPKIRRVKYLGSQFARRIQSDLAVSISSAVEDDDPSRQW